MPHGHHIYAKVSDMTKATMYAYPQSDHALPNWKCVIQYCAKFLRINLPGQETNNQYSNTSTSIRFHIYHIISHCTTHCRLLLNYTKSFRKWKHDYASEESTRIYTRKEIVMMETNISNFHTSFILEMVVSIITRTFLVYIFVYCPEVVSCWHLQQRFLSVNGSLPCFLQRSIRW